MSDKGLKAGGRPLTKLEKLACEIAISTPRKKSKYVGSACVSWQIVEDIRAAMDLEIGEGAYETVRQNFETLKERHKLGKGKANV